MRVYGIKSCDTCRKAVRALEAELHDIRADPLGPEVIARFLDTFGDALVNTRSTTWRGLDAETRQRDPGDLLAAHPTLMKRPVIETPDGTLYLGWGEAVKARLL
ncbi:ArsC/Spx/MgsR family protein [Dinoroseobacter sp. S124A]|uniref:ArsC/Spx/MgsR family protein n=1 Tax=Dinoroseobacter sp. S124A TaxID=3415128 RepID=UPI003C79B435